MKGKRKEGEKRRREKNGGKNRVKINKGKVGRKKILLSPQSVRYLLGGQKYNFGGGWEEYIFTYFI